MDNLPSQPIGYDPAVAGGDNSAYLKVIVARLAGRKKVIHLSSICAFMSDQKYTTVFFIEKGRCRAVDITTSIVKLIPWLPERFVRTHRGVVVDSDRIVSYDHTLIHATVSLAGVATPFPVSRRHRPAVNKLFKAMEA